MWWRERRGTLPRLYQVVEGWDLSKHTQLDETCHDPSAKEGNEN
jgi:hypothetical protein